jgi:hypothetical protein
MVVTHGGLEGGYGLCLRDNKPTFVYNFLSIDRPTFTAKDPVPKGKTKLVVANVRFTPSLCSAKSTMLSFLLG